MMMIITIISFRNKSENILLTLFPPKQLIVLRWMLLLVSKNPKLWTGPRFCLACTNNPSNSVLRVGSDRVTEIRADILIHGQ